MAYAIVTGAAKGIGKAIATELAEKNYHLILIDIDPFGLKETKEYLEKSYPIHVRTIILDLSEKNAAEIIFNNTRSFHDNITILVNNAGYGLNGSFTELNLEQQLNIIDVNVKAQLKLAHYFIPVLKKATKAYLLNVGSTTSYQSVPFLAIYAASKAFVLSFTRSLKHELKLTNVSVSCLSPGSTDTDFVNRAGMQAHTLRIADRFNMTPQAVAKIAVKGLFRGTTEIIPGFSNKLNAYLPKFFPKTFVEKIAAGIYKKREPNHIISNQIITQN